ncbi:MAG: heme transporter [Thermoleophilales bacterium]|nr:heme transporter [Thermoleophilales bacterium]
MQGNKPSRNIAARAGRWSASHRKTAIFGWLAFVLIALTVGMQVGAKQMSPNSGPGESGRAGAAIDRAFPSDESASEQVLVQRKAGKVSDAQFRAAITQVASKLQHTQHVIDVRSPLSRGNHAQLSPDGRSALVAFKVKGANDVIETNVAPSLDAVAALQKSHPELRVEQFGDASVSKALTETQGKDFARAETLSLPITLLILAIAFGAIVAAGIPVLLALSAVAGTLGLVSLVSHVLPLDSNMSSVILLVGLAVGVDYSLFYLRREREERAKGRSPKEALEVAAATSGRAVLISGFTVIIAMAGMYFAGDQTFVSFGTGTIMVVAVAMIGSLTVLPALLAALGDRVEKGRIPFLRKMKSDNGESRVWSAIITRTMRRPKVAVALSAGLLLAMAVPVLSMHTELPGYETYSRGIPVIKTYDRIQAAFPGGAAPAMVVVEAKDVTAPKVVAGIQRMTDRAVKSGVGNNPVDVQVSKNKSVAIVSLPLDGNGTDDKANAALDKLRGDIVPATLNNVDGVTANVTGATAGTQDFNQVMSSHVAIVFAFVLSLAFLLLLVTFRSIVIPIKAIVLNLLSVGAAYGVLIATFQWGWGEKLLGFHSNGAITAWLPMFMFVILFGLSMDYHVFILSRIREAVDRGMSTDQAVEHGIKSTAGAVTSAAVVMVAVFAIFATLSSLDMKQMGVGLSAAILIDATIVRGVLLPASMKLLGKWNWWLPRRLEFLPEIRHEGEVAPAQA